MESVVPINEVMQSQGRALGGEALTEGVEGLSGEGMVGEDGDFGAKLHIVAFLDEATAAASRGGYVPPRQASINRLNLSNQQATRNFQEPFLQV